MADVAFRQHAWRDLERIDSLIAAVDPGAARKFRQRVLRRIALLQRFPRGAQPRPEFGRDICTIPIGRYIVILRATTSKVTILRIVHGARDLPRLFQEPR
jgi:toxin ParE1/3/4